MTNHVLDIRPKTIEIAKVGFKILQLQYDHMYTCDRISIGKIRHGDRFKYLTRIDGKFYGVNMRVVLEGKNIKNEIIKVVHNNLYNFCDMEINKLVSNLLIKYDGRSKYDITINRNKYNGDIRTIFYLIYSNLKNKMIDEIADIERRHKTLQNNFDDFILNFSNL